MNKSYIDEFSAQRAIWQIVKSPTVLAESGNSTETVIATFMNYQDCHCFMQGLGAAITGEKFGVFDQKTMVLTDDKRMVCYKMISLYAYIGANKL